MTNRIHIDAPTGVIELEGERDFVEAQLDKLLPLIRACGFGAKPNVDLSATRFDESVDDRGNASGGESSGAGTIGGNKKSRRGRVRSPRGQSCADRILTLKSDGFFKSPRTVSDIVAELGKKGWTHKNNQVAAAAVSLFGRNDIQRTSNGKGFSYYWDRD